MKLWNNIKIKYHKRCLKNDRNLYEKINTYLHIAENKEDSFYEEAKIYKDVLWSEILRYNKKINELEESK